MNDQTRGDTPGTGPDFEAPLKRDRKRLRSSEPLPAATPSPRSAAPAPAAEDPQRLQEPDWTPVEALFGDAAAAAPVADRHADRDVDLAGGEDTVAATAATAAPAKRRLGMNLLRKSPVEPSAETAVDVAAVEEPAAEGAEPIAHPPAPAPPITSNHVPAEPYVPPGGFSGPGHPILGPIAPVPAAQHPGLARLDIAAIVAAIVLPPIGLITAIVALVRGKQIRGWASDLARAAVSVSVVMTLVFAGVGGYVWVTETEKAEQLAVAKAEQRAHDRVEAASAPFCEMLEANPAIYSTADPDYGWPALDAPGGYNAAIAGYAAVWAQLASVAPEGIAAETAAISERVAGVVSIANALGSSNRAGDLLGLHAKDDLATVESWYVEYCNPPQIPAE